MIKDQSFNDLYKTINKWAVILIMLLAIGAVMIMSLMGTDFNLSGGLMSSSDMSSLFSALGKL